MLALAQPNLGRRRPRTARENHLHLGPVRCLVETEQRSRIDRKTGFLGDLPQQAFVDVFINREMSARQIPMTWPVAHLARAAQQQDSAIFSNDRTVHADPELCFDNVHGGRQKSSAVRSQALLAR